MKAVVKGFFIFLIVVFSIAIALQPASASLDQQESVLEHGKYIATIAGCTSCHTPYTTDYADPTKLTLEQIQVLAFDERPALDANKLMAGGRAFDLGPAGIVFTRNITPDTETGLGGWSDEQVKVAIRTGQRPSGEMLFPVMPYHNFNGMADADLDAIIAYMRSSKAVNNVPPPSTVSTEGLKPLPYNRGIVAPASENKAARGEYLVKYVVGCTDCHTPVDPATGAPQIDKYLGGGQPYEGPWGIVYGGNITPDKTTGIGEWSEAEIKRAIVSGIGRDGRRLILMPWYAYSVLSDADADAVAYYLKNVLPAVDNDVPNASLKEDFIVMIEQETSEQALPLSVIMAIVIAVLLIVVSLFIFAKGKNA